MSNYDDNSYSFTGIEIPFVLSIISLFFWNSLILLPIKLLTVMFHELSHGIMAIMTGGKIISIDIGLNQGGLCLTRGGWPILVMSAGYLGSLLCGSGLLLLSFKKKANKIITVILGVVLIIVTLMWVKRTEAMVITYSTAITLILIGLKLKEFYCSMFVKFISLISCLYVVFDIKEDLLDRTVCDSDAYQIAKLIFPSSPSIGSYFIGILWLSIALFIVWKVFKIAFK